MRYLGGKNLSGTYQRIINLIPPHENYIEPFLGSGAIMRLKKPAARSFGVDLIALKMALPAGVATVTGCGLKFLENYKFEGNEFVYCDPPYLLSTRKNRRRYKHELTEADHIRLLGILTALPCPVLLSGYPSDLYQNFLGSWNRDEFQVMNRDHSWASEVLWYNYARPARLHDFAYVGDNFRERLRIKRRRDRWTARIRRIPPAERAALFAALVDVMGETG